MDINEIYQKLESAGDDWSDKDAAAGLLEETKHTVLSECMADWPNDSNAAAETKARRDPRFKAHIKEMVEARRLANRAKVRYSSIEKWVDLMRTKESTERAKISRGI